MPKIIFIAVLLFAHNCFANDSALQSKEAIFLPDYSVLKEVPTQSKDIKAYFYRNQDVNQSKYTGVIVAPVELYQTPIEGKVSKEQIQNTQNEIANIIKQDLSSFIQIKDYPSSNTAKLTVAITGAVVENGEFKPRNLLPISAALKIASRVAGVDQKRVVLIIETKVVDSETNELLTASSTQIGGDKFRLDDSTQDEFKKTAIQWANLAMKYGIPKLNLQKEQ